MEDFISRLKISSIITVLTVSICVFFPSLGFKNSGNNHPAKVDDSKGCMDCHSKEGMGASIVQMWRESKHSKNDIGCYNCHEAEQADADGFEHYGKRIATIVSPKDCGKCHEQEVTEFDGSHHAQAAQFIGSLDNILGEIVEGAAAANSGCRQCHGSIVQVKNGKLDATTWPNTGIGRVNPDGRVKALAQLVIPGTVSLSHKPASLRHAVNVTWDPTILRWKFILNLNTV